MKLFRRFFIQKSLRFVGVSNVISHSFQRALNIILLKNAISDLRKVSCAVALDFNTKILFICCPKSALVLYMYIIVRFCSCKAIAKLTQVRQDLLTSCSSTNAKNGLSSYLKTKTRLHKQV